MSTDPNSDFYRQFEERFRTSRDNIKRRLQVYQPLLKFLQSEEIATPRHIAPRALDLGCGRGEWLELLLESGFHVQGVDLDDGMLRACKQCNLPAEKCDALTKLAQTPDNSLTLVSAFHMVEHISFEMLLNIIDQSLRVLLPGGVLLMETPNSENLSVGTFSFYLDPTHTKPIPHALLAFVTEYKGFATQQIWRVNEHRTLEHNDEISLHDLVFGASPDYAVVAIKGTTPKIIDRFQAIMPIEMGVALDSITRRYDEQTNRRLSLVEQRITEIEQRLQVAETPGRVGPARRSVRVAKLFYHSIKHHGVPGLWLPLSQYLNASPRRRNTALRLLRRWKLPRVTAALFDDSAIRAKFATHHKPAPVQALPPSAQAIDTLVLSELYTHIEE